MNRRSVQVFLILLSISIFSFVILWSWNLGEKLIIGHDVGYRINIKDFFFSLFYTWSDSLNFGLPKFVNPGAIPIHLPEYIISLFIKNTILIQRLLLFYWLFILFIPFVLVYFFFSTKEDKEKKTFFIFATLLYSVNFFNLQGWGVFWRTRFSLEILLPIVFFFLHNSLLERKIKYKQLLLVLFLSIVLNGGGSPPLFGPLIALWVLVGLYHILVRNGRIQLFKIYAKLTVLFAVGYIALSSYWIIPYFSSALNAYGSYIENSGGISSVTTWLNVIDENTSILNLLRLQGMSSWYDNIDHPFSYNYRDNWFLILASFSWAVLAFAAPLFAKNTRDKLFCYCLILISLVGIFLTAGSHPPLGWFFIQLFNHVPGFTIFRSAFYKFGPLLWLSFSLLGAYSLYRISEYINIRKTVVLHAAFIIVVVLFVCIYHFPYFSNKFFNWDKTFTTLVKVPGYVYDFERWGDGNTVTGRILLLPPLEKQYNADMYKWGYWSLELLPNAISPHTFLDRNSGSLLSDKYLQRLYKSILDYDDTTFKKITHLLDVEYLLVRNDYYFDYPTRETIPPQRFTSAFQNSKVVEKVGDFGKWKLYKNKYYSPNRISLSSSEIVLSGDLNGFDSEIDYVDKDQIILENTELAQDPDTVIVIPEKIKKDSISGPDDKNGLHLYPDSEFYFLKELWNSRKLSQISSDVQVIDFYLGIIEKKLIELEYLEKFDKRVHINTQIEKIFKDLDLFEEYFARLSIESKSDMQSLLRIDKYFSHYRKVVNGFNFYYIENNLSIIERIIKIENLIYSKGKKNVECFDDINCEIYTLSIPYDGNYRLLINNQSFSDIKALYFNNNIIVPERKGDVLWRSIELPNLKRDKFNVLLVQHEPRIIYNHFSLRNDESRSIDLPDFKKFTLSFDYTIHEKKYTITKTIKNTISGNIHTERKYLIDSGMYVEEVNLDEFSKLESIVIAPSKINTKDAFIEIGEVEIARRDEDIFLVKYKKEKTAFSNISYEKKNPTKWIASSERLPEHSYVVFSEFFDTGWKSNLDSEHVKVNGGMNAWQIKTSANSKNIVISFDQQKYVLIGFFVSLTSVIFIGIFLVVWRSKRNKI